jgi:hypothetical protein
VLCKILRAGVERESGSESQCTCLPNGVLAITSTLEFPCPRNDELVSHSKTIPTEYYLIFHIVEVLFLVRMSFDLESLTIIAGEAYLDCACFMNVDTSQSLINQKKCIGYSSCVKALRSTDRHHLHDLKI